MALGTVERSEGWKELTDKSHQTLGQLSNAGSMVPPITPCSMETLAFSQL